MQVIYIDTLLCVNLFIDYIILYTEKKFLHINTKQLRILLGASSGAILTLPVFIIKDNPIISLCYKLTTAIIITAISFGFRSPRKILIRSAVFFGISMFICGIVLAIELFFSTDNIVLYNDVVYFNISPLVIVIATMVIYVVLLLFDKFYYAEKNNCVIKQITIILDNGESISFESSVDTGCNLREPFSGLPVIITEKEVINTPIPENKIRLIPFDTISQEGSMVGFKPHKLYINNKVIDGGCYIGICENKLNGEIKSIMGSELLEAL